MDVVAMRSSPLKNDVTLVTQLSSERFDKLLSVLKNWLGPVSAVIYVDSYERHALTKMMRMHPAIRTRSNIDIHVVERNGVSISNFCYKCSNPQGAQFPFVGRSMKQLKSLMFHIKRNCAF